MQRLIQPEEYMPTPPRYTSPGYRRAVREDLNDWIRTQVRERDAAARKAIEDEKAAVLADLERNKPK